MPGDHRMKPTWYYGVGPKAKAHIWDWARARTLCGLYTCTFDYPDQDDVAVQCKRCARVLATRTPPASGTGAA